MQRFRLMKIYVAFVLVVLAITIACTAWLS
jgi:hypothetical protein